MAWDCRLMSDFYNHPKTIKLLRVYGGDGVVALQRLWCFATEYRPNGVLTDMTREDLADTCRIDAKRLDFIDDLVSMRWLDYDAEHQVYSIHNWVLRQPNVVNREKLSRQKADAARAKAAIERDKRDAEATRKAKRKQRYEAQKQGVSAGAVQTHVHVLCPNPTQPTNKRHSLSPLSQPEAVAPRVREREIFFELAKKSGVELRNPRGWEQLLGQLVAAGQDMASLSAVMSWALGDGFWRTRLQSPRAFGANWFKAAEQMQQSSDFQTTASDGQAVRKGYTAEEWAELKREREGRGQAEPP